MALTHGLVGVQEQNVTNTSDTASAGPLMLDAKPSKLGSADQPSMWPRALPGLPSECDSEVSTPLADIAGLQYRVTKGLQRCSTVVCAQKPAAAAAVACTPAHAITLISAACQPQLVSQLPEEDTFDC